MKVLTANRNDHVSSREWMKTVGCRSWSGPGWRSLLLVVRTQAGTRDFSFSVPLTLTTHRRLTPRLRMGRTVPVLPLCTGMTCYGKTFTFIKFISVLSVRPCTVSQIIKFSVFLTLWSRGTGFASRCNASFFCLFSVETRVRTSGCMLT